MINQPGPEMQKLADFIHATIKAQGCRCNFCQLPLIKHVAWFHYATLSLMCFECSIDSFYHPELFQKSILPGPAFLMPPQNQPGQLTIQ